MISKKISLIFKFSSIKTHYDLITIGAYANRSAKIVNSLSKNRLRILTINPEKQQVEPSLAPGLLPPLLTVNQKNQSFSDIQQGVYVNKIIPEQNKIVLTNGNKYSYKGLIFSGVTRQWKNLNYYPGLAKQIDMEDSFVYADNLYQNFERIYNRSIGTIIITIPQHKNFACQNIFMFNLLDKMKRNQKSWQKQSDCIKMIVINEGQFIDPFNKQANTQIEALINFHGIDYIKNMKFKADYQRRKIFLQNKSQIDYNCLFHYLPYQLPSALSNSNLNLNDFSPQTTLHQHFPNISLISNLQNKAPTLISVMNLMQTSAYNMHYNLMGLSQSKVIKSKNLNQYKIWIDAFRVISIAYDKERYFGDRIIEANKELIQFSFWKNIRSYLWGIYLKYLGHLAISIIVNGNNKKIWPLSRTPKPINIKLEATSKNKI